MNISALLQRIRLSLLLSILLASHAGVASADDSVLLWLASGTRGAPCDYPDHCNRSQGLGCVDGSCAHVGAQGEYCRPYSMSDRCDAGLGCDRLSGICVPAGGMEQPCFESPANSCNQGLECVSGTCWATGGDGELCRPDNSCNAGLFCAQYLCQKSPIGKVVHRTTAEASACVFDVPARFRELSARTGHSSVFSFDAREGDRLPPFNTKVAEFTLNRHVQGIVRLPWSTHLFLTSREVKALNETSGLMISDRSMGRFFYPTRLSGYDALHAGGISIFGSRVAVAVESGVMGEDNRAGWIDFWDYVQSDSSPLTWRHQIDTRHLGDGSHRPAAVAYTKTADDQGLIFFLGPRSESAWLMREHRGLWYLVQAFKKGGGNGFDPLPSSWKYYQNFHFVTDCNGGLYLVGAGDAADPGLLPITRENWVDLYGLAAVARGKYQLNHLSSWNPKYDRDRCDLFYSGNITVTDDGQLEFVCSDGTSDIADYDNIGVAEIRR